MPSFYIIVSILVNVKTKMKNMVNVLTSYMSFVEEKLGIRAG